MYNHQDTYPFRQDAEVKTYLELIILPVHIWVPFLVTDTVHGYVFVFTRVEPMYSFLVVCVPQPNKYELA